MTTRGIVNAPLVNAPPPLHITKLSVDSLRKLPHWDVKLYLWPYVFEANSVILKNWETRQLHKLLMWLWCIMPFKPMQSLCATQKSVSTLSSLMGLVEYDRATTGLYHCLQI